jgi:nucleoside-diphosphate-sugar epimerase
MRIVITGGGGFLGRKLARAILERGALTDSEGRRRELRELVLLDIAEAPTFGDARVSAIAGDLASDALVERAFARPVDSVFHLAAVVSGEAEQDFDKGWRVNVDATRRWLEACRAQGGRPKFVFTSSVSVFGGDLPAVLPDTQRTTPQSSYGAQKAVGELYVNDYTRKGFIDGRALRLPTVSVRPGKPNRAASSFASGILREPLNGVGAVCPVPLETRMWLVSPRHAVHNLVVGHEAPASAFGATRNVNVPGISVTVREMVEALRRVAGDAVADRITYAIDPAIDAIVRTWPRDFEATLGRRLGMTSDGSFDEAIRQYVDDELRQR